MGWYNRLAVFAPLGPQGVLTVHQLREVYKRVVESGCEGIKRGVAALLHDDQLLWIKIHRRVACRVVHGAFFVQVSAWLLRFPEFRQFNSNLAVAVACTQHKEHP